jgi:hypothetical protein
MIVERPDAFGHYAIEATNLINHRIGHTLTLVSKLRDVHLLINTGARPAAATFAVIAAARFAIPHRG